MKYKNVNIVYIFYFMENLKKPTVLSPSDNSSEAGVQIYPLDEEEIAEEKKHQDFPENNEENLTAEIMIEPIETTMATDLEEEEPKNNITMELEDIDVKPATTVVGLDESPAVAAAIVPAVTSARTYKHKRCPRGSRRSRITHHCRKYRVTKKLKRCRKGHRRNKKTHRCRKIKIKK
jgi:hypothetical protein